MASASTFKYDPFERFDLLKQQQADRRRSQQDVQDIHNKDTAPDRRRAGVQSNYRNDQEQADRRRAEVLGQIPGIDEGIKFDVSLDWPTTIKIGLSVAGGIILAEGVRSLFSNGK